MKKKANVIIKPNHSRESAERMIRRFIKKTKKERIVEEVRERSHYKKAFNKEKREERESANALNIVKNKKRIRAQQRRARKK